MRHDPDALLKADFVVTEAIDGHLIQTLAELPDRVGNDRDALKHLSRDRINDIKELDDHFFVEGKLALCLHLGAHL